MTVAFLSDNTVKMWRQTRSIGEIAVRSLEATIGARDERGRFGAQLVALIAEILTDCRVSQLKAVRIHHTHQPTLSKVMRARMDSVSLDKLVGWLLVLGQSVEVHIGRNASGALATLKVVADGRRAVD